MNQRTITFRSCTIVIDYDAQHIETKFPDGSVAPARPEDSDAYRATAERLGYGADTWRLCVDHEILHTWVPQMMGEPRSTILWNVAHGGAKHWPPGGKEEEGYVTSVQTWLNTGEIDDLAYTFLERCAQLFEIDLLAVEHQARALLG